MSCPDTNTENTHTHTHTHTHKVMVTTARDEVMTLRMPVYLRCPARVAVFLTTQSFTPFSRETCHHHRYSLFSVCSERIHVRSKFWVKQHKLRSNLTIERWKMDKLARRVARHKQIILGLVIFPAFMLLRWVGSQHFWRCSSNPNVHVMFFFFKGITFSGKNLRTQMTLKTSPSLPQSQITK